MIFIFDNKRYVTCGIDNEVPQTLQMVIWDLIETMPADNDYLQVFDLSVDNGLQKIVHSQEEPEYKKEHCYVADSPITAKIYVIDDETHSTMLLAEEY